MAMTRDVLVTLTEELLDGVGSARWGTTLKLQALSAVHTRGWRRILNANRAVRWAKRSVTQDSDGRVALSSLSSGSGDSAERFYKVLAVSNGDGTIRYSLGEFMDDPLGTTHAPTQASYRVWRQGDYLQVLPVQSGGSLLVWVNHLPTAIGDLTGGSVNITWPTDYEMILALEAAAELAAKGGSELEAAEAYRRRAESYWQDLLADVSRFSTDPLFMQAGDSASDWMP